MQRRPTAKKAIRSADEAPAPKVTTRESSGSELLFMPAKPRRTFEEIIKQIQSNIEEGRLQHGDKLPAERVLAAQFEVSRNTVREALRMLEISGVITLRRGSSGGAFVADPKAVNNYLMGAIRLTDFSVADLTHAMRSFTNMLFQAAMPTLGKTDLDALEANIKEAEAVRDDPQKRAMIQIHFYRVLAEASGNKILMAITDVFVEILHRWVSWLGPLGGDKVIRSRRKVVEALRSGDLKAADREVQRHLEEVHSLWLKG
jgi:DNA-binding FadR family transcriptional regulator